MKRLLRFSLGLTLVLAVAAGIFAGWLSATRVNARDLPKLKSGDIVFQIAGSTQSKAISLASHSLYTHVGIVEVTRDGRTQVIEAAGPVHATPIEPWIERGASGRITVKRVKGLTEADAAKAVRAAHAYDGTPYDIFFYKSHDAIYCSELIHLAFKEGPGIAIGKDERVKDLNIGNAAVRALIEARWRQHPACIAAKAESFKACYPLILQQTLVTPASVARDDKLETVYTNFGLAAD